MAALVSDKHLQFVIERYDDIEKLLQEVDYAKQSLPGEVCNAIWAAIRELKPFFTENGLTVVEVDGEIDWFDPKLCAHDEKKDELTGPHFRFRSDSVRWKCLVGEDDPHTYLALYITFKSRKSADWKAEYKQWQSDFAPHQEELKVRGFDVELYEEDDVGRDGAWAVTYYLKNEVNIKALADADTFKASIQRAAKNLTSAVLPILRECDAAQ